MLHNKSGGRRTSYKKPDTIASGLRGVYAWLWGAHGQSVGIMVALGAAS